MINMNKIKEIINSAETDLNECYDYLLLLKSKNFNGLENFQPKLADTLYCLSDLYEKLKSETKLYNTQKILGNKQISENQLYLNAIKKLIKIGKNMGDIFAWYFYKDSPNKIKEHLKHQGTGLFTPRLGGIGEVEFLKRFQFVGGCLLILHANTSMLRIADFSIFSPTNGIIGTVEIKTKKTGVEGQADITAHIVTEHTDIAKKLYEEFANMNNDLNEDFRQPYILNRDRFEKQVALQKKIVTIEKTKLINGVKADLDFELITNAYKNGISVNKENCLIAIVQKSTNPTFLDRITSFNSQNPPVEKLNELVANVFNENKKENYPPLVGELKPFVITPHCAPMFFEDIDAEIYRDILLEKISIYLLLNPSIFVEYFKKNGYEITVNNEAKIITMSKVIKDNRVILNFKFIYQLLVERIITVNCVFEMIKDIIYRLEKNPNSKIKIEM